MGASGKLRGRLYTEKSDGLKIICPRPYGVGKGKERVGKGKERVAEEIVSWGTCFTPHISMYSLDLFS